MSKSKLVVDQAGEAYGVKFYCPGCEREQVIPTGPASKGARWGFNGDYDRPTLTPSILARWYEPTEEGERMMDAGEPLRPGMDRYPGRDMVCHSFVTDGRIQFLGDCTHALAGQTVDLPELKE